MRRFAFILALLIVWAAFGFGVNRFIAGRKSNLTSSTSTVTPVQETPTFSLPGSIYVSQGGHIYRLHGGQFTDLKLPSATGSWIQPSVVFGGRLLAVARADAYSDVYLLDGSTGAIANQLTSNATKTGRTELNAWSYWPHLASDGFTIFLDYDGPKTGTSFQVDFAVWSGPVDGKLEKTQWTNPNTYTGGDVAPVPMPGGGVVYAKYGIDSKLQIVSRIATVSKPGADPVFLTAESDDCSSPSVNPAGTEVAAICTSDTQSARLVVVPVPAAPAAGVKPTASPAAPPAPRVLVNNCLCASPTWSPDGKSVLYLAPGDASGHFQLWWIDQVDAAQPAPPKQLTTHLDLDATSPPAWAADKN